MSAMSRMKHREDPEEIPRIAMSAPAAQEAREVHDVPLGLHEEREVERAALAVAAKTSAGSSASSAANGGRRYDPAEEDRERLRRA